MSGGTKKAGSFRGKSNKLGHGGRAAQMLHCQIMLDDCASLASPNDPSCWDEVSEAQAELFAQAARRGLRIVRAETFSSVSLDFLFGEDC